MELTVNGVKRQLNPASTIEQVLDQLGYDHAFVAVALNRSCVKRSEYAVQAVHPGDELEILAPMAGG